MRKTLGWTGLRTSAVALSLAFGAASAARADVISMPATATIDYSTSGQIDTSAGVTGTNVISYDSITPGKTDAAGNVEGSFTSPSQFSLGNFVVAALPVGQSTTYTNTPFSITYISTSVNGATPSPNDTPIVLTGVLNGTITGGSQSSAVATFDKADAAMFRTGDYLDTLKVLDNPIHLVPSSSLNGTSTAQAELSVVYSPEPPPSPINTPEPTSIALFLTAIGGLGLRRRLRQSAR